MTNLNDDLRNRPRTPATYNTGRDYNSERTSVDRVRWGPIWAGIFASISTLFLLGLLGVAVGLSAYDVKENARGFGMGAGIWQILSVIIAFMVGGWVAGRTGDSPARRTGWLNGALVWAVTVPLILLMLTSGVSGIVSFAGNMAAQAMPRQQGISSQAPDQMGAAQRASGQMQAAGDSIRDAASGQRPLNEASVNTAQGVAWWTFASFGLGLAAAAMGGMLGAKAIRSAEDYGPSNSNIATA